MTGRRGISDHMAAVLAREGIDPKSVLGTGDGGRVTMVDLAAARMHVDLATVTGHGPNGAVTIEDVRAVYDIHQTRDAKKTRAAAAVTPSAGSRVVEQRSIWSSGATVRVDPWSLNPLVDDARQARPQHVRAAMSETSVVPTLFASGDLPVFLASGLDPKILARLPWRLRHYGALADGQTLFKLVETYSGPDGQDKLHSSSLYGPELTREGNTEYHERVSQWLYGTNLSDEAKSSPLRAAARKADYDVMFPDEGFKAAKKLAEQEDRAAKAKFESEQAERQRKRATGFDATRGYPV